VTIDLVPLIGVEREVLLARLAEITGALQGLYKEEAMLMAQERRAKVTAWIRSEAPTVAQRDREAEAAAMEELAALFEVRGQIKAQEAERDLIHRLLEG
jgi:hypothetical protein